MKSKALVLGLVFSLLVCSGNLAAKERRGADLRILKLDRTLLRGELIAVKPASLLLLAGEDRSVDIKDILTITIIKKSKALPGFLIGTGAGLLAGFAIGSTGDPNAFIMSDEAAAGVLIALASPLIGLTAGALMGSDQKIQIVGMPPEQIKASLEKLRRQARITNFQ